MHDMARLYAGSLLLFVFNFTEIPECGDRFITLHLGSLFIEMPIFNFTLPTLYGAYSHFHLDGLMVGYTEPKK